MKETKTKNEMKRFGITSNLYFEIWERQIGYRMRVTPVVIGLFGKWNETAEKGLKGIVGEQRT